MSKIKKVIFTLILCITISLITGCNCNNCKKKFTKSGITITLDNNFYETENVAYQVVYLSRKFGFNGDWELKTSLIGINSLNEYMNTILKNSKRDYLTIQTYQDESNSVYFLYTFYDEIVKEREFSYMLITKEGNSKYYVMQFWCQKKDFNEKTKEKMLNWAKTIIVE